MGFTLRAKSGSFEFLERNERLVALRDRREAVRFLRGLQLDSAQAAALRSSLLKGDGRTKALNDQEFFELLASRIAGGEISVLRRPQVSSSRNGDEPEAVRGRQADPRSTAAVSSWIEILLVDHAGQPVPNQPYRIKLPDGSTDEGRLDDFGHAEYYGINPGSCEISFPELANDEWEPAP
jgi:hypothetical protein